MSVLDFGVAGARKGGVRFRIGGTRGVARNRTRDRAGPQLARAGVFLL